MLDTNELQQELGNEEKTFLETTARIKEQNVAATKGKHRHKAKCAKLPSTSAWLDELRDRASDYAKIRRWFSKTKDKSRKVEPFRIWLARLRAVEISSGCLADTGTRHWLPNHRESSACQRASKSCFLVDTARWLSVNLAWRKQGVENAEDFETHGLMQHSGGDLEGLLSGLNGLTSVLACLAWWYRIAGEMEGTPRWKKLVEDVAWVRREKH
ncbi:hypothetical protein B0H14DRAFT_2565893 [Mycena olivaceomarginata]|nr:hypothetical protein B0H14DRAFT_2565893 [Mycena olivaceomarginata]